jgi:acyl-CoA hydrolase
MNTLQEEYRRRLTTVDDALARIKDGDVVVSAMCANEPVAFLSRLHEAAPPLRDVDVYMCLPMRDYPFFTRPDMAGHVRLVSWFHSAGARKAARDGLDTVSYQPNHLYLAALDLLSWRKVNVFVGSCTPPDHAGYVSLSTSLVYEKECLEAADVVILEVNDRLPRTLGDTHVRVDRVTAFYEHSAPLPQLPATTPGEKDLAIGRHCADLIQDGSTLQVGIGGIPNACTLALAERGRRHLGVHTEMFVDSMVDLYYQGVIDNSRKTLGKDKFTAAFVLGTQKVYDFVHDNLAVELRRGSWAVRPDVLSQNHRMVSLNTCILVDLTGQVAAESVGPWQYSGTGGQFATQTGAREAPEGRAILACYSTSGRDGQQTSIVPMLPEGTAVTTHRSTTDCIVTEQGVAELRGRDVRRRAENLIAIAHPDHRDKLRFEARKLGYL